MQSNSILTNWNFSTLHKVKWLGIHFNANLSFKEHINICTAKATSAFYYMARLANNKRGLSPTAFRQLYIAYMTSIYDYALLV
ncbi:hypothetical protein LCER1_G007206 [Lachnellula cervina]|uniref:Uncharacterized protein n=1 Tax=Lachnellula cervina TaxID=1316786 RepID=A0A7D8UI74_9HELO|nr:hypothetical protein LCER1_G007206 [Lachnellula cervina]